MITSFDSIKCYKGFEIKLRTHLNAIGKTEYYTLLNIVEHRYQWRSKPCESASDAISLAVEQIDSLLL